MDGCLITKEDWGCNYSNPSSSFRDFSPGNSSFNNSSSKMNVVLLRDFLTSSLNSNTYPPPLSSSSYSFASNPTTNHTSNTKRGVLSLVEPEPVTLLNPSTLNASDFNGASANGEEESGEDGLFGSQLSDSGLLEEIIRKFFPKNEYDNPNARTEKRFVSSCNYGVDSVSMSTTGHVGVDVDGSGFFCFNTQSDNHPTNFPVNGVDGEG